MRIHKTLKSYYLMLFVWILINEYLLIVIDNENDY